MSRSSFDRKFHEALHDHTVQPPAEAWAGIEAALPSGGSRRRFPLYGWMILAAIAGIALSAFVIGEFGAERNDGPQLSQPSAQDVIVNEMGVSPASQTPTTLSNKESNDNNSQSEAAAIQSDNNEPASSVTDSQAKPLADHIAAADASVSDSPTSEASGSGDVLDAQTSNADDQGVENAITEEAIAEEVSEESAAFTPLPGVGLRSLQSSEFNPNYSMFKVTDCYDFGGKSKGNIVLDIYTGPTYAMRSLESRNEDVSAYINTRDSTEKSQISWHAGIRAGYEHKSGLVVRIGAHYSLVNEVFRTQRREMYYQIITDSMFNPIDTILVTGTRTKQTQNRYHAVDIPLLVGYQINNGDWDFGIHAGPTFNLLFKAKGDMLDPTGEISSFSDTEDPNYSPVFKDRLGISIYGGLYASRRIGSNLYAFFEPHVLHRLESLTLDNYPIDQRQTQISLSVGLRYKLK